MKWILFPHGGCINHGCEALARTIAAQIRQIDDHADIDIYTYHIESDRRYKLNEAGTLVQIPTQNVVTKGIKGLWWRIKAKISRTDLDKILIAHKHAIYKKSDIAISLGGDNYCYTGMQHVVSEHTKAIDYFGIPSVLWGCSLEKSMLNPKVIAELNQYKAIIARESITLATLNEIGLGDKSFFATDSAFLLPAEYTEWPDPKLRDKTIVGINISPLLNRYANSELIIQNYRNLLAEILKKPDTYIAIIPHVEQENNNDYEAALGLTSGMDMARISIIHNGYNCRQLKSLISQCDCFIGARTHATIAAYSTCVPTLVVGYSTKSKGIARDIFGSEDGLVIPVQAFTGPLSLVDYFRKFYNKKEELRTKLKAEIGEYSHKAEEAMDIITKIINNK